MTGFEDVATPVDAQPSPGGFDAVATPYGEPKAPDTTRVQKMAQDNLAANDNKVTLKGGEPKPPPTIEQNLSTAAGVPINNLLNPDDKTPFPRAIRENLTKSYADGSASNAGDFWQSTLHAISPIAADAKEFLANVGKSESAILSDTLNPAGAPTGMSADQYRDWYNKQPKQGALAQFGEDTSPILSAVSLPFSPAFSILGAAGRYIEKQSVEPEERAQMTPQEIEKRGNVAEAAGQGLAGVLLAGSPLLHPPIADNIFPPSRTSEKPSSIPEPPTIEGEYADTAQKLLPPPWDDHPGSEPIKDIVAKKTNTDSAGVLSTDVDQHIADATIHKAPTANDFKAVESVTGGALTEKTLHIVYNETGVKPDQVFTDAQRNPQVAADIAAGKVPEQYEHLVEPKPALPPEQADNLTVSHDDATRSFTVVDKEGDHISGGFDSAKEARHYIEDEKFKADERAAIEEEQNQKAQDVATPKDAESALTPKASEGIYSDVEAKVAGMSPEIKTARLESLNKKMEAAIITPKEMVEREALSAKVQEPKAVSPFDHRPTEREIPTDNYSKNLSEYSPTMYRETSPHDALELLPYGGVATDVGELHLADTTDMATGQGANKGVMIAFDTKGLKGARNRSKPAADISYSQGFGEYLGKYNKQSDYQNAVSAVRVTKDAIIGKTEKAMLSRTLKILEEKGWTKKETDKYTEYTKPKTAYERPEHLEKSSVAEQAIISGAEKTGAGAMAQRGTEAPMRGGAAPLEGGLFDMAGRGQGDLLAQKPKPNFIPPSETGKSTSLKSFLLNNGGKIDETKQLISMRENGKMRESDSGLDRATEIAHQAGYFDHRPSIPELQDKLLETNGGLEHTRLQDADRMAKAKEAAETKKNFDPANIEKEAHSAGLDTDIVKGETDKQRTSRLTKALQEFYKNQEGSGAADAMRQAIGGVIKTAEKFTGKLTGGLFEKLADGYIKTFQPELMGDKALRFDAYLAKFKAKGQEAMNAFYRADATEMKRFDRMTHEERQEWRYDHETGRWNEEENPDHAKEQALYDAMHKAEHDAGISQAAYKENYLPHQWENPEAVKKYFNSEAYVKKYGPDWFTKRSVFQLTQDAERAGFKLKTDNPVRMRIARQLASDVSLRTMDLLHDMESSGTATRATSFGIDKKIAKTQAAIAEIEAKYKKAFEKVNNPDQARMENVSPAVSRLMQTVEARLNDLRGRLDDFTKEKVANKLTPAQLAELKTGFRVIGPDSKAWNIHPQVMPLWKNAVEMKGLYENQGIEGDIYRAYSQIKNIYTDVKLSLSLFHPTHEVLINVAGGLVAPIHHLVQGGKFSDLAWKDFTNVLPIGDGRGIDAYNTAPEARTSEQKADVQRMMEGGFVPTMSARDMVHFKDNWDKAIAKVGLNNLRLIGTALQLPGKVFEPLFSKWIPRLRSQMYFSLTDKALLRDPALAMDAGRRGEAFRAISQDIDRGYGQLNQDTLFWNKNVRDAFNTSYISGGWKLAQIYNVRGLLQPANILYKFAKTGEFSKADITYNMLQAYAYTAVTLAFGAAINKILGNPIGKTWQEAKDIKDYMWSIVKDCQYPKIGTNPDGTPIRVSQPSFIKEWFMAARDIDEQGLIGGAGKFVYEGMMIPAIKETLGVFGDGLSDALQMKSNPIGKDGLGRAMISNPLDYHQWMNAGWDALNPITVSSYERAEEKGTALGKGLGLAGMPLAGAHVDQTPFEHKLLAVYHEQNPPKDDVYTAKLKAEMRGAVTNKDTDAQSEIADKMKTQGMTPDQISFSKKPFKTTYSQFAWSKLSAQDQKHLIESASPEEKKKFKLKPQ